MTEAKVLLVDDVPGERANFERAFHRGLAVAPSRPDVVYATIELAGRKGGFWRSEDGGMSWAKKSDYISGGTGPHYYQEIWADPHRFDSVYQATYPNPRGILWMKVVVGPRGKLVGVCRGPDGAAAGCRDRDCAPAPRASRPCCPRTSATAARPPAR